MRSYIFKLWLSLLHEEGGGGGGGGENACSTWYRRITMYCIYIYVQINKAHS